MNNDGIDKYVAMQKSYYNDLTSNMTLDEIKNIIAWNQHDNWSDQALKWHENYFLGTVDYTQSMGLEFGCGIGRLLKAFRHRFKCLDGVDISPVFLRQAREYGVPDDCNLYLCNGWNLELVPINTYNLVYSGWVMEHICVHEIRNNYFKEFYRVLQSNGKIVVQMCGGRYLANTPARSWYDNYYDAPVTNSSCDVRIDNVYDVFDDLSNIGYQNISFELLKLNPKTLSQCQPPQFSGHQYNIKIKASK